MRISDWSSDVCSSDLIIGGVLLPAARVVKGAGTGARLINNAATGALYGGISGAGQGDGFVERAGNALEGAAVGGAIGLAADPLIRAGSKVAGNIKNAVLPYVSRRAGQALARAQAQREVGRAPHTPDTTPAQAASRIRIRAAENVPASVSDLDDATRQLTGHSSRGMGPAQRAVRNHVHPRPSTMHHRTGHN